MLVLFSEAKEIIKAARGAAKLAEKKARNGCFKCIRLTVHSPEQEKFAKAYLRKNYPQYTRMILTKVVAVEERSFVQLGTLLSTA